MAISHLLLLEILGILCQLVSGAVDVEGSEVGEGVGGHALEDPAGAAEVEVPHQLARTLLQPEPPLGYLERGTEAAAYSRHLLLRSKALAEVEALHQLAPVVSS